MKRKSSENSESGVTIRILAIDLGVTERRVRQLRDDGIISARSDGRFDLEESRACYAAFTGSEFERARFLDSVSIMSADVEAEIGRLANAPAAKKTAMAEVIGPRVGRLIGRLKVCPNLTKGEARRAFERDAIERMCGDFVSAFLKAAGLELDMAS